MLRFDSVCDLKSFGLWLLLQNMPPHNNISIKYVSEHVFTYVLYFDMILDQIPQLKGTLTKTFENL